MKQTVRFDLGVWLFVRIWLGNPPTNPECCWVYPKTTGEWEQIHINIWFEINYWGFKRCKRIGGGLKWNFGSCLFGEKEKEQMIL
jgi:hypothetical protein